VVEREGGGENNEEKKSRPICGEKKATPPKAAGYTETRIEHVQA
jgi:hypothetical protein